MLETGGNVTGHLTLMEQGERVTEPAIAWWKYMLNDDAEAKKMFVGADCGLCNSKDEFEFSAALIGFLEATLASDDEKNSFVTPIRLPDTVSEYLAALVPDVLNRQACGRHAAVRAWVNASRTDGFAKLMSEVDPNDADKRAILARLRDASKAAALNMPRLLAAL